MVAYRVEVVENNLKSSNLNLSQSQIKALKNKFYSHFCDIYLEMIKLDYLTNKEIKDRFKVLNPEIANNFFSNGKSVILMVSHYGGYEWCTTLNNYFEHQVAAIYTPLKDKELEKLTLKSRKKHGIELISRYNALDKIRNLEKSGKKVYPSPKNLRIIQNKSDQKNFYSKNNLPTSRFKNYSNIQDLKRNFFNDNFEFPFVWKSSRFGYDGKGVKIIKNIEDLDFSYDHQCLIEEKVSIKKELSVIVSRNIDGKIKCFPVVEMEFNEKSNLVEYVMCPANISKETKEKAIIVASEIAKKFEMVGLLAVELFITNDDEILINEVAPRPHNSGHHTIECCVTSQFDQHIRSILNLPLGETDILIPGIMVNLVGENMEEGNAVYKNINDIFDIPGVYIHIYGKKKSRLNRKMGHITIVNKDINKAIEIGKSIKNKIKVTS